MLFLQNAEHIICTLSTTLSLRIRLVLGYLTVSSMRGLAPPFPLELVPDVGSTKLEVPGFGSPTVLWLQGVRDTYMNADNYDK